MGNEVVESNNIAFNWIIVQLDCKPSVDGLQDYVVVCHWRYAATYQLLYTDVYGACGFTINPEQPDFTPYPELTEAQVIGWLEGSLDVTLLQEELTASMEALINPPIVSPPLPWLKEGESIVEPSYT